MNDTVVNEIRVGDRIVVMELNSVHFEKMHVYSNLLWTPDKMNAIGRVGLVILVDDSSESAIIRFYASEMCERPYLKYWDCTQEHTLPLRSIRKISQVYYQANDKVVLISLSAPRKDVSLESTYIVKNANHSSNNYQIQSISHKFPRTPRQDVLREVSSHETLLPVYLGPALTQLQQEIEIRPPRSDPRRGRGGYRGPISTHRATGSTDDPRRILYEPREASNRIEGSELIDAIDKWNRTGCKMEFISLVREKHELVNKAVDGILPVQTAVIQGNLDALVMLISVGADRSAVDSSKNSLFHLAAMHGHAKIIECLLNLIPGEINSVNLDGETALHLAARHSKNSAVVFDRLLGAQMIKLNITSLEGDTVMHTVVKLPESDTKQAILSRLLMYSRGHINLNQLNSSGYNPLHVACINGMTKTVETILNNRPQLNQVACKTGLLPIHLSALYGKYKTLSVFIENHPETIHVQVASTRQSCLHLSVTQWQGVVDKDLDRLASIQALISAGLNVNSRDCRGETALHALLQEMTCNVDVYAALDLRSIFASLGKDMKMTELATKVLPHWELAALYLIAANGADPRIASEAGTRALDIIPGLVSTVFGAQLARGACGRPRSLLPMTSSSVEKFDIKEVTLCTFDCNDNAADVEFVPCGHRVICKSCVNSTSLRRCPLCYKAISSAKCTVDGSIVDLSKKAAEERKQAEIEEQRRKEEEAARAVAEKKEIEVRELKARLEELEHSVQQCVICMDAVPSIAFLCGHRACSECSKALTTCHSCRKPIKERITLF